MSIESTAYEVRCPRCDVSFPPETRKCIHCGGATAKASEPRLAQWVPQEPGDSISEMPEPIEPEESSIFSMDPSDDEAGDVESKSSLPRTLLRSFGSLIWIGLLIAFTLARDCGGE